MTIKLITAFLICCSITGSAFAQNQGGLGAYAALHDKWPCEAMMRAYKGSATLRLAVLWNSFGTNLSCLDQWAADPRPKYLESHLLNEVCQRNNRCGNYEVLKSLTVDQYKKKLQANDEALFTRIRSNLQPLAEWYARNPNVACAISGGLESNLDSKNYLNLVAAIKPLFPERCQWVWNPVGRSTPVKPITGFITEGHGDAPDVTPPCISNMDGVDTDLPARPAIVSPKIAYNDLPRFLASSASCDATFLWIAEFNGLKRGGAFVDPRKRTNFPSSEIFDQLQKKLVFRVKLPKPWGAEDEKGKKGCKTFLKVPDGAKKNFLWKQSDPIVLQRGAVTFLPTSYNKTSFKLASVYVMKGPKKIATAYEHKLYTQDKSNRHFFRFRKLAKDFPFNVVAHYGSVCAVIPNPKIRVD